MAQQDEGNQQMVAGDRARLESSSTIADGSKQQQAATPVHRVPDCDLDANQAKRKPQVAGGKWVK